MGKTDPKYEALFTPWKVGNVEIKNRIVMCPMGGTSLFGWFELGGCHFDKEAAKLFLERANNNVGLIIPGIAPLRDTFWGKWLWQNPKMFDELKVYMDEIHKTGAKLFVQLTAGMGRSWAITELVAPLHKNKITRAIIKPVIDTSHELACPSPQKSRWAHDIECPEMTVEQIHEIIEAFAKTAKLCRDAGVDGVEVHAVHEGYLLDQFAIEFFNKRTDEYGGSFENRYRFAVDVVKAIKASCGEDFPVSLRYSVESKMKDFCYGAMPGEEYTEVGRAMPESERNETNVLRVREYFVPFYDEHNCDLTRPYDGITELLRTLKTRGYQLAVASNKYQAATEKIVAHLFPDIFDVVLGERDKVARKPNPQIVYDISFHLQHELSKDTCLYVGDSLVDAATAKAAQLPFVACTWGFCTSEQLQTANPDYMVEHPSEITKLIQQTHIGILFVET